MLSCNKLTSCGCFKSPREEIPNFINQLLFFQTHILGYFIILLRFTVLNLWKMQGIVKHSRHPPYFHFQSLQMQMGVSVIALSTGSNATSQALFSVAF